MENIEIVMGGEELVFSVEFEDDNDHGTPWENECGHGPVSDWTTRDKAPGELVLAADRSHKRYYDFAEACRIALRDEWDAAPYNDGSETPRQQAAKAARADYDNLRAWCNDDWRYVGVIVTLLDDEGEPTEVSDQLFGVDTCDDNHERQAREIADELAHGMGTQWDRRDVTTSTFVMLED